jgi:hypothetical protein
MRIGRFRVPVGLIVVAVIAILLGWSSLAAKPMKQCTIENNCNGPPPAPVPIATDYSNWVVACADHYDQSSWPRKLEPCNSDGSITIDKPATVDLFFVPKPGLKNYSMPRFTPYNSGYANVKLTFGRCKPTDGGCFAVGNPTTESGNKSMPNFNIDVEHSVVFTVWLVCSTEHQPDCSEAGKILHGWTFRLRVRHLLLVVRVCLVAQGRLRVSVALAELAGQSFIGIAVAEQLIQVDCVG